MKQCGLYVRVSTNLQAMVKDGSLDTQVDTLKKFVEFKKATSGEPWEVAEIYREEGKSGKNTDRPEYQRMLADIRSGHITALLCVKIDRVSRSLMDFYHLHELLERHDVTFISLHENWDTSSPMGRFGLKLTLAVAELEREQTAERLREKMAWRAREGLWNGGRVLGYDLDPNEKGVLRPNEAEGEIVRFLFTRYLETQSMYETARLANAEGYRGKSFQSRRGILHEGKPFTKTDVNRVLRNPVYIGKIRQKGRLFPGRHEAIVPMELWNTVQGRLPKGRVGQRKHGRKRTFVYKLKGLLRCGHCGGFMTTGAGTGRNGIHRYYKCTRRWDGSDRCATRMLPAKAIEDVVLDRIKELTRTPDLVREILAASNTDASEARRRLEHDREETLQQLSLVDDRLRRLLDFIGEGRATETVREELMSLEDRKRHLKERQGELASRA